MPRLQLTVAYNGAPWQGWQSQPGAVGVQDQVERALRLITGQPTHVHGSGRTDARVHALAQSAHCDVPQHLAHLQPQQWARAINTHLPSSIRILASQSVPQDFHARFHATGKTYLYRIHRADVLPPLEVDRAWHIYGPLELDLLRSTAQHFVGRHNFARLSANRGDMTEAQRRSDPTATTRSIYSAEVSTKGQLIYIRFHGQGFLYKMVRLMVGAMVQVARRKAPESWLQDLVADPSGDKNPHCAPPEGLYLVSVDYPPESPQSPEPTPAA
jgi:tRNA pseudouridine38-40 synthase